MLHVSRLPLPQPRAQKIKSWLGSEGAREFAEYLVNLDAALTAEAANELVQAGENEANSESARQKADEAAEVRRMIDRMNEMRDPDFKFEYCTVSPATTATTQEPI